MKRIEIVHVHVKDFKRYPAGSYEDNENIKKSKNNSALIACNHGEGCVDFDAAFDELNKIGYNGYIDLECTYTGRASLEKDIEFLKKYVD